MQRLSLSNTENYPGDDFRASDNHWLPFAEAIKSFPRGTDIPLVINGKKVYTTNKGKNLNPCTGEVLSTYQNAEAEHSELAIKAALEAKPAWASLSPESRMQKFRDLEAVLTKWKYEICGATAAECGYVATETSISFAELIDFIRFNSKFYSELMLEQMGDGPMETNQLVMRPLKGFTCAVTPFNFPIAIGYHLPLVMALTGNTVIWKPSSDAVMTSYLLMCALDEAGFPPGVINMITGSGSKCLPTILKHPELTALNFTGSNDTAKVFGSYLYSTEVKRPHYPRFVAETGGKDFVVADKDIDIVDTAKLIAQGAFGRSGQKCSATSALFVDEKVWPQLKEELVKMANSLVVGNVAERNCDMGPVINEAAYDSIVGFIERAKKDPTCKLLAGGEFSKTKGFFVQPTIIEVSTDRHEMLETEIFGPVLTVKTFKKLEDAVQLINNHPYRLTGAVISRDEVFLEKAVPMLSQLAGNFYVNRKTTGAVVNQQPFGGDGASGTNCKAGGRWYILNFVSQGTITRRHTRTSTPTAFDKVKKY